MTWYNPFSWFRRRPQKLLDISDVITRIEPTQTPFLNRIGGLVMQPAKERSGARTVIYNRCKFTFGQLEAIFGIPGDIIRGRVDSGWSIEAAVMTPVRKKSKNKPKQPEVQVAFNRPGWPT